MSYKKLESKDVSKSNATSSQSAILSAPKSTLKPSKATNTGSIKAQLQETKNMTKEKDSNIIKTEALPKLITQEAKSQTDLDHDLALKLATGDEHNQALPIEFTNNMSENKDILLQNNLQSNCGKNALKCLCILLQRGDYITVVVSPIILCILLLIMFMINSKLIIVWFLSALIFYCLLIFSYFYVFDSGTDSILDLFTLSMLYGGFMGVFGWIFGWLLALTNNILVGPFIFMQSGFILNSTANTVLFGTVACIMYGGIFPFVLIWVKSDKRLIDQCFSARCKISNFNILDEYQRLPQTLNLPEHQIEQFMAANENEIMLKLETAQKRLRMECVSSVIGYFGAIYILSFLLKFNSMNMLDSTLIFVYGYFLKDFIFGILFAVIASYIVGRRKLYQVRMNNKCMYYGLIMILGILQQSISTVLCGLYPSVGLRMYIVYVSIGFNVIVCIMAVVEIRHQRKVFKVQLDALFIYNSINNLQISESSVRMDKLSLTTITE